MPEISRNDLLSCSGLGIESSEPRNDHTGLTEIRRKGRTFREHAIAVRVTSGGDVEAVRRRCPDQGAERQSPRRAIRQPEVREGMNVIQVTSVICPGIVRV